MNCKNRIYFTNGKRQLYYLQDTGEFPERCLLFSGFTGKKSFADVLGNKNDVLGKLADALGNIADAVGNRFNRLMGV